MTEESDNFAAEDATHLAPRHRRRRAPLLLIERVTVCHLVVFLVASTWAFGGQAEWVRAPLTAWGFLGSLITLSALLRSFNGSGMEKTIAWALPIVGFNALVLIAALNPNLQEIKVSGDTLLAATGGRPGWPSSARPALARTALLEFDAIWLSCFNIVFVLRRRRAIRIILFCAAANALILSVFGTLQKLSGANGLYFGSVPTPQKYFFSSFVYHNHWGAFALLMTTVCLALSRHYSRRHQGRDAVHSPATLGIVVVLIIVATIPLSGSRSSTVLAILLLGSALVWWTLRVMRKRKHFNESIAPPIVFATLIAALAIGAVWSVGRTTIERRFALTRDQIAAARVQRQPDQRVQLYRDTWQMAKAKPWFGWGMASYPYVFTIFNSRAPLPHFPVFYHDAHSDWLQALAEHGVIGTALVVSAVIIPLAQLWRRRKASPVVAPLLAGCGLLLVYAALEFPFGNFSVVLCWWTCFFSAVQYARLSDHPSALADAGVDGGAA